MIKQETYYFNNRWDLFSLIPSNATNILDVGCGNGWLGKQLKMTRSCNIVGIEVTDQGKEAEPFYDEVLITNIEESDIPYNKGSFDCIVLGDVLEHLVDPWSALSKLVHYLKDDGSIVISIPNVGHYTTITSLLKSRFRYEEEGILDKTHLRFFTSESFNELISDAGLKKIKLLRNTSSGRIMRILNIVSFGLLNDLITFQFLAVSVKE